MYFIAKYDTEIFLIKKALGKKRLVIVLSSKSALQNPQNTASLRLKSRLAEKQNREKRTHRTCTGINGHDNTVVNTKLNAKILYKNLSTT